MKILSTLIAVVLSTIVVGHIFPYGFPLVLPIVILTFIYFIILTTLNGRRVVIDKNLLAVFVLVVGLVVYGALISGELYNKLASDLVNIIVISLLFLPILYVIKGGYFLYLSNRFTWLTTLAIIPVSILCWYKFFRLLQGTHLDWLIKVREGYSYPWGTSLQPDYNMGSLGLLTGMFCSFSLFSKSKSFTFKAFFFGCSLMIFIASMMTGSRRAMIVGMLLAIASIIFIIHYIVRFIIRTFMGGNLSLIRLKNIMVVFLFTGVLISLSSTIFGGLESNKMYVTEVGKISNRLDSLTDFSFALQKSRGSHVDMTFELYNERSIPKLLFGDGFEYLKDMGHLTNVKEDYPHNPVLSALLYSGLFGAIVVLAGLIWASIIYFNLWHSYRLFSSLFFLSLTFVAISGNTLFSNRLFILLLCIGVLLRRVTIKSGGLYHLATPVKL